MNSVTLPPDAEARYARFRSAVREYRSFWPHGNSRKRRRAFALARKELPTLLTSSVKTIKSLKVGAETGILYMSPYTESGVNMCPFASAGCAAACLGHSSGQMVFDTSRIARILRTRAFLQERAFFLELLHHEIGLLRKRAARKGNRPFVRLNGTSDVSWETVAPDLFASFPDVVFYDYTKAASRFDRDLPPNYSLTFSRSEDNDNACADLLARGFNVAMVFRNALPEAVIVTKSTDGSGRLRFSTWAGPDLVGSVFPVVDGDETDARPDDSRGVVVGLTTKGPKAARDRSGFVL